MARRTEASPEGTVATEVVINQQRHVERAAGAVVPRTNSPVAERGVAPYAPVRKRGARYRDDPEELRRELDERLRKELAWEQEVQREVFSFVESEKNVAWTALHEYRAAGSEAIERERMRSRARVSEIQERVRRLAQEVQVAQ